MTDYYPYEIHVTVRSPDVDAFRAFCTANALKPIVLDLQDREGTTVLTDVMTSSKVTGTVMHAWDEMAGIARTLSISGFNVVRRKLETVPWHHAMGRYFEAHIAVRVNDDNIDDLRESARYAKCHMSQNVFKRDGSGMSIFLLTRRDYTASREVFEIGVDASVEFLELDGFHVLKVEKELCVYDSHTAHDAAWIAQGQ